MNIIGRMWHHILRTHRTRALEVEVAQQRAELDRLRAENRALLNSILGIAGIPPIYVTAAELASLAGEPGSPPDAAAPTDPPGSTNRRPGGPVSPETLPSKSHSESARADDESIFRPPPPAAPAEEMTGARAAGNPSLGSSRPRNDSLPSSPRMRAVATPLRRRSWHQINRMLEIESTRKQVTTD